MSVSKHSGWAQWKHFKTWEQTQTGNLQVGTKVDLYFTYKIADFDPYVQQCGFITPHGTRLVNGRWNNKFVRCKTVKKFSCNHWDATGYKMYRGENVRSNLTRHCVKSCFLKVITKILGPKCYRLAELLPCLQYDTPRLSPLQAELERTQVLDILVVSMAFVALLGHWGSVFFFSSIQHLALTLYFRLRDVLELWHKLFFAWHSVLKYLRQSLTLIQW